MREADFVYASAYTRTMENKMLARADLEALLGAPSCEEALRILSDKGYGNSARGQSVDAEAMLRNELVHAWNEIEAACPKDAPIRLLLYPHDFHNLKTILKAVFGGANYEALMLRPCTVPPEAMHRAIAEGDIESLPEIFQKPARDAYQVLARDNDGQLAEMILDKGLFAVMADAAGQSKSSFLMDWVDLHIALMDMKMALRGAYNGKSKAFLRDAMLECGRIDADSLADAAALHGGKGDTAAVVQVIAQSGFDAAAKAARESFAAFEKWCDNELLKTARAARQKLFGLETVFGFFIAKQFELQAVRIILSGLRGGIPAEQLRERLRDLYA